ncbi:MAG: septation protein A [Gammaproteobacteria bacterium]|nr:septation protein A [Gammaproteobacteria bacterium]
MKLLIDFFPIILFFISYHQANFLVENTFIGSMLDPTKSELITATIVATGVAIVASFVQVTYHWIMTRKFEKMHLFSLALITVLGGLTIMFGNPDFVKWKPTVLNWLFAGVFFISFFIGEKTLVERAMGNQIELPDFVWNRLNIAWVVFFIISGAANLYVAFYYALELDEKTRMDTWVDFKLFGLMGLTLLFIILQAIYLTRHISEEDEAIEETIEAEKHILEDK